MVPLALLFFLQSCQLLCVVLPCEWVIVRDLQTPPVHLQSLSASAQMKIPCWTKPSISLMLGVWHVQWQCSIKENSSSYNRYLKSLQDCSYLHLAITRLFLSASLTATESNELLSQIRFWGILLWYVSLLADQRRMRHFHHRKVRNCTL